MGAKFSKKKSEEKSQKKAQKIPEHFKEKHASSKSPKILTQEDSAVPRLFSATPEPPGSTPSSGVSNRSSLPGSKAEGENVTSLRLKPSKMGAGDHALPDWPKADYLQLSLYSLLPERMLNYNEECLDFDSYSESGKQQTLEAELMGLVGYLYLHPNLYPVHNMQDYHTERDIDIDQMDVSRYEELLNDLKSANLTTKDLLKKDAIEELAALWEDKSVPSLHRLAKLLYAFGREMSIKRHRMHGFLESLVPDVVSAEGADILGRYYSYSDHEDVSLRDVADLVDVTGAIVVTPNGYLMCRVSEFDDMNLWKYNQEMHRVLAHGPSEGYHKMHSNVISPVPGKPDTGDRPGMIQLIMDGCEESDAVRQPSANHDETLISTRRSTTVRESTSRDSTTDNGHRPLQNIESLNLTSQKFGQLKSKQPQTVVTNRPIVQESRHKNQKSDREIEQSKEQPELFHCSYVHGKDTVAISSGRTHKTSSNRSFSSYENCNSSDKSLLATPISSDTTQAESNQAQLLTPTAGTRDYFLRENVNLHETQYDATKRMDRPISKLESIQMNFNETQAGKSEINPALTTQQDRLSVIRPSDAIQNDKGMASTFASTISGDDLATVNSESTSTALPKTVSRQKWRPLKTRNFAKPQRPASLTKSGAVKTTLVPKERQFTATPKSADSTEPASVESLISANSGSRQTFSKLSRTQNFDAVPQLVDEGPFNNNHPTSITSTTIRELGKYYESHRAVYDMTQKSSRPASPTLGAPRRAFLVNSAAFSVKPNDSTTISPVLTLHSNTTASCFANHPGYTARHGYPPLQLTSVKHLQSENSCSKSRGTRTRTATPILDVASQSLTARVNSRTTPSTGTPCSSDVTSASHSTDSFNRVGMKLATIASGEQSSDEEIHSNKEKGSTPESNKFGSGRSVQSQNISQHQRMHNNDGVSQVITDFNSKNASTNEGEKTQSATKNSSVAVHSRSEKVDKTQEIGVEKCPKCYHLPLPCEEGCQALVHRYGPPKPARPTSIRVLAGMVSMIQIQNPSATDPEVCQLLNDAIGQDRRLTRAETDKVMRFISDNADITDEIVDKALQKCSIDNSNNSDYSQDQLRANIAAHRLNHGIVTLRDLDALVSKATGSDSKIPSLMSVATAQYTVDRSHITGSC